MKVGSTNVSLLSCHFYYTYELVNIVHFSKGKSYIFISLLKIMWDISKHHFLSGRVLLSSILDIHGSAVEEETDQNWMAVDVRGGPVKSFDPAEVINEWP